MGTTSIGSGGVTFPDGITQSSSAIGYGQTWTNVSSSRAAGTTYTNSTGRPIAVYTRWAGNGSIGQINPYIDGTDSGFLLWYSPTTSYVTQHFMIIPAGATYRYTLTYGYFQTWWELR